jgi:hypothetical protein
MLQAKSAHWRLKHAPGEAGALTTKRCFCAAKPRPTLKLFEGKSPQGAPCLRAEDFIQPSPLSGRVFINDLLGCEHDLRSDS